MNIESKQAFTLQPGDLLPVAMEPEPGAALRVWRVLSVTRPRQSDDGLLRVRVYLDDGQAGTVELLAYATVCVLAGGES